MQLFAARPAARSIAWLRVVSFQLSILLGAVWLVACGAPEQPPSTGTVDGDAAGIPQGPHPIIILDIDTLRADRLGCYGNVRDTSPVIDEMAKEGLLFEWAFSQAPNTPPSQTSILTSLYPTTHGMIENEDRVPEEVTTLAEALRDAGYATAAFVDGGYMSPNFGINQGFDLYASSGAGLGAFGDKVLDWVRDHADETFLLLVHTYDVHTPYDPPEPWRSLFLDELEQPPNEGFEPDVERMEGIRRSVWTDTPETLAPNDLAYTLALYDAGIRYVDDWIGKFFATLDEVGLRDRATIVLISDHGEEFLEHGSVLHEKLYATVTRVPLVFRLPGGQAGGRTIPDVVEGVDLMPTLLDLAGVEPPQGLQGQSLVPLMRGESGRPAPAFGESPFFGERRFVAYEDHRLLLTRKTDAVELYAFRSDPLEQNDLQASDPDRVVRLRSAIENWQEMVERARESLGDAGSGGEGELDPEIRERLKELGYIQD